MRKDLVLIAAVDKNWGIGKDNKLLKPVPEDLKRFSGFTRGNMIIVGRKTLESFKDKKPLPDRINVVLTRDIKFNREGTVVAHDIKDLESITENYSGEIYVCGGASIYSLLLPYCSKAFITQIDEEFDADTHLVNLDKEDDWIIKDAGEWQESRAGVRFRYVEYINKKHTIQG